jgi:hypothetical protein
MTWKEFLESTIGIRFSLDAKNVNYPTLKGMASCFTEPIVRAALNPPVAMTVTHQPALSALLTHRNTQAFPKRVQVVPTLPLSIRNVLTKKISMSAFIPNLKDGDFPPTELNGPRIA